MPTKAEEVTVHAPEAFSSGGRSKTGKLITKPIARTNAKWHPVTAAAIVATALVVLAVTWVGGDRGLFNSWIASTLGLVLVAPALVVAAYEVLRDDELEPYRGKALYLRASVCSLAYVVLWGVFALLASRGLITGELWNWMFVVPAFVLVGGGMAWATLDLEFGDAMFHYGFFLLVTVVLRWAAGMKWIWDVSV